MRYPLIGSLALAAALAGAALAAAAPKHESLQCPAATTISLTATPKAEGWNAAKLTDTARLKEARIEMQELRCIYDANVASHAVVLTHALPADHVCKVGADAKTIDCRPVLGALADLSH